MAITTWRYPQPFTPVINGLAALGTGGELNGFVWKENENVRVYVYCKLGTGFSITGELSIAVPNTASLIRADFGNPTADGSDPIFGTVMASARNLPIFKSFGPVTLVGTDRLALHDHRLRPLDFNTPGVWLPGGWFQVSIYGPTRELIAS